MKRNLRSTELDHEVTILVKYVVCRPTSGQASVLELIAQIVRHLTAAVGSRTAYVESGSPCENGYCEYLDPQKIGELLN